MLQHFGSDQPLGFTLMSGMRCLESLNGMGNLVPLEPSYIISWSDSNQLSRRLSLFYWHGSSSSNRYLHFSFHDNSSARTFNIYVTFSSSYWYHVYLTVASGNYGYANLYVPGYHPSTTEFEGYTSSAMGTISPITLDSRFAITLGGTNYPSDFHDFCGYTGHLYFIPGYYSTSDHYFRNQLRYGIRRIFNLTKY